MNINMWVILESVHRVLSCAAADYTSENDINTLYCIGELVNLRLWEW